MHIKRNGGLNTLDVILFDGRDKVSRGIRKGGTGCGQ
jgi:hypothetical protein